MREVNGLPMPWVNETEAQYGSIDRLRDGFSYVAQRSSDAVRNMKKPTLGPRARRWLQDDANTVENGEEVTEDEESNSIYQIEAPPFF